MKTSVAWILFASTVIGFLVDSAYTHPLHQDDLQRRRESGVVHVIVNGEEVPHGSLGSGAPNDNGFSRFSGFGGGIGGGGFKHF
ncbi:hypothetical protein BDY19DRAFT_994540 [Irpex rosettiformis]|uniref:Uncharacterized protein n=1 Tax=Irpex rosettiformis TaxID=378272 RepID=A0ACB8U1Q0_9APHY|nr:hypothetical protein BDY19DRAFT_994540 [Irpex rosettiformis]